MVRDPEQRFKPRAFLCTNEAADPVQILCWFVARWRLEVTFEEARRHLGVETQRQWTQKAIARTTPALLGLFSLVTLWVDASVSQIVRYTFDNVDFNFLPGRSLVRVDTATATMTMGQPFPGVWLPESLMVEGALTLATGTYRAEYARRFSDYRQGDVQMRFRVKDEPK